MTASARFVPENRDLDLAALSAADYELVRGLHGVIKRGDMTLLCQRGGTDPELYVYQADRGAYYARHFPGGSHGTCTGYRISRMTPEHERGRETWLSGFALAGISAAAEVSTDNRTRLDAVAFGDRIIGLEVQVQPQSPAVVKGRDTRRRHATAFTGAHARHLAEPIETVWFAPVGRPQWLGHVASVSCGNRSWESTPDPRSVPAIGLRRVDIKPCDATWFPHCPQRSYGWCRGRHAWNEPMRGLFVADVAALAPAGELVPVQIGRYVYLTDKASLERSRDFGMTRPQPPEPRPQATSRECESPRHMAVLPVRTLPASEAKWYREWSEIRARSNNYAPAGRPVVDVPLPDDPLPREHPCNAGRVPCGRLDTRFYIVGHRCPEHVPGKA